MKQIGFIGLGAMGAPMAWNIHKAGYGLTVYNRSPDASRPFADAGITVQTSPAAVARDSDTVIIMVSDPAALDAVLHGPEGVLAGLGQNSLAINMSTVDHAATLQAAEAVTGAGGRFIDAPVSGTVKPAEDGTLVVLAGGEAADIDEATPLLEAMGKAVVRCGAAGQGTHMKLVLNLMLGGMMELLAEGLMLSRRFGLDAEQVLGAIAAGPLGAPLYQMKGEMMVKGRFPKQFPIDLLFKDMNLVLGEAGRNGVPLPAIAAVREQLSAARALGHGDEDMAAIIRVLEHASGAAG
ncbi:MAG: NAD(P)-dependent oxidoreductase [Gammaproteobacteria bacterium]|jgi:3-hydroxyisobutyrate dehydrogenase-like beta-hydroxyacid dehydrogenase